MRFERLWAKVQEEIPGARVVNRDRSWVRFMGPSYSDYATTIGKTIYAPAAFFEGWSDNQKYMLIRHEMQHLKQFQSWPLGPRWSWLNTILVALCYVLVLPVFATMRAQFERQGYYQNMLVCWELGGLRTPEDQAEVIDWVASQFCGSGYLWMWNRFSAMKWASEQVDNIVATSPKDPYNVDLWEQK